MPLETELKTFDKLKPQLLSDEGKYAVIFGETLIGVYSNYDDALKIGYERCKLEPFLVKKILGSEPVNFFSRAFTTCHT